VLISGRKTALTYAACVKAADVVIINVPIEHTESTIATVGPLLAAGQLLVDNTSVKAGPVNAMLQATAAGVEVLGMHTIFGPSVEALRRQNVVFTRTARSDVVSAEFEAIFHKYGARITHTTPDYHDRQMAFHQNLEHLSKIAIAEVLCRFFPTADADNYASPNSRTTLGTIGRILSGDPNLYAEIQTANPQGPPLLQAFSEVVQHLCAAISSGDSKPLKASMQKSIDAMGPELLADLKSRSKKMGPAD
jgi:prephenate dehydrogenase